MAANTGAVVIRMKSNKIVLYLDAHNELESQEALELVEVLENAGFTIKPIYFKEKDDEIVTPWLVDPSGGSYYGIQQIRSFVEYELDVARERTADTGG